ncbi:MAG: hypothetical protein HC804_01615, partial [Anaerolineae bacterium]|nr:hypothetical protein [Anaerolineae bacterium]
MWRRFNVYAKKSLLWLAALAIIALAIAACQPQVETVEVTRVVENTVVETVTVEGQVVEVTRVVETTVVETVVETVEVEVPAETVAEGPVEFMAADNTTYRSVTFGDIDTLDPALAYDTASGAVNLQRNGTVDLLQSHRPQYVCARSGYGS